MVPRSPTHWTDELRPVYGIAWKSIAYVGKTEWTFVRESYIRGEGALGDSKMQGKSGHLKNIYYSR